MADMADDESRAPRLVGAMSAILVLSLIFLLLRLVAKIRGGKKVGLDDYILAVSWAAFAAYIGLSIASTKYGIGMHIADLRSSGVDFVYANKLMNIGQFFAIISIAVAKSSFCFTLLRLSASRWQKVLLYGVLVTVNLMFFLCAIFLFTTCVPIEKKWDSRIPGRCGAYMQQVIFSIFIAAYSAFTDFVLALFPWVLIWNLQMKKLEKIGLCVAMSMGVLSGITATVKTAYLIESLNWTDVSYQLTDVMIWSASETAAIIIAASIPFLRLAVKTLPTRRSSAREMRGSGASHAYNNMARLRFSDPTDLHSLDRSAPRTINHIEAEPAAAEAARHHYHAHLHRDDDGSDRSSLNDEEKGRISFQAMLEEGRVGPRGHGAIMWTREITVEHHDREDVDVGDQKELVISEKA